MTAEQPHGMAIVTHVLKSALDLQVLITLMEDGTRWWDARAMSAKLAIDAAVVRTVLDRLCSKNLLDIRITDDIRYRYRPGTPELAAASEALLAAFRRDPSALEKLITD